VSSVVAAVIERRSVPDRRERPTPFLSRYAVLGGRRCTGRRALERDCTFVDQHGPVTFALVAAVVALNFLDAWFTILFLSHGGTEVNPIVAALLEGGCWPFLLVKSVGIGLCVAVLTLTARFPVARFGLALVGAGYAALLVWHLSLLSVLPELCVDVGR
jgi:hypothetical protein